MSSEATRASWNAATKIHNTHKGDQAAFLRAGGDTLFSEELELLGDVDGRDVVHLQCNAGQDSLCLARRGARVTGVDFSDEAISFARALSADASIAASFEHAEVIAWLASTTARFDIAFASYGVVGWLGDLDAWARGVARVLRTGGRLVYVDFHPVLFSIGPTLHLDGDDYFSREPFVEPVGDYVGAAGPALGGDGAAAQPNDIPATSWQHGLAQIVGALVNAGMTLEALHEHPHSNGCKIHASLVPTSDRRWVWPEGTARVPLMFSLSARKD